ncbi:WD40 repeat-like protein [Ascodesmis nigricans]|uniref:WD40 repeat-like protein n=1 Tax=Ascodesmis nigricans TaxID=341454 RepID=A0A4S2MI99_9PEZI|nr:WD40 repeat-like protein [Ascodesmis nigricans]
MSDPAPKQRELPSPPDDAISSIDFSPTSSRLLVSSWDSNVHLYDTSGAGSKIASFTHPSPVLSCCFGRDDNEMFSACLDWSVNHLDPATGTIRTLYTHTSGVSSLLFSTAHNLLISGSWDGSLSLLPVTSSTPTPTTLRLPTKIHSLSTSTHHLIVALSNRLFHLYDLRHFVPGNPSSLAPTQTRESSLKFMTRTIACMPPYPNRDPSLDGYACSSIEGRIAVEFYDPSPETQARKYAFKCHRQVEKQPSSESSPPVAEEEVDVVYPVNALTFHPIIPSLFASGGGDGIVSLWDGEKKRRIRNLPRYRASVAALAWSRDGKRLVVATSGGFEGGDQEGECSRESVGVWVREMEDELKPKGKGK